MRTDLPASVHGGWVDGYSQAGGWVEGNETNIGRLRPKDEALRMAALAGGKTALLEKARAALSSGDAPPSAGSARRERNYCLEYAQLLRRQIEGR